MKSPAVLHPTPPHPAASPETDLYLPTPILVSLSVCLSTFRFSSKTSVLCVCVSGFKPPPQNRNVTMRKM